jgi:outer membrane biosynthesis protein TonB
MSFIKEHIHGITGATVFVIIMLLLLFLLGFSTPLPLPEERGILIDFGGGGSVNAGASSQTASDTRNNVTQTPSNSGYNTQDMEDAPSLQTSDKPNTNNTPTTSATENTTTTTEQRPVLNDRLSGLNIGGALSGGGTGTGTSGSGTGSGNPGLGDGINGSGRGPGGIGGNLTGRRQIKKIDPEQKENMFGKVELQITVDEKGDVSSISLVSTNCNECVPLAIAAVKQWKYEAKPGSGYQVGVVEIGFQPK